MQFTKGIGLYLGAALYAALSATLLLTGNEVLCLFPFALLLIYAAIFHTKTTFLALGFFTPLSVNIEEWVDGFGLFLPTEPLLFGFMVFLAFMEMRKPLVSSYAWRHPIVIIAGLYIIWLIACSINSTHPVASFKFTLVRLWFFVPMLLLGTKVFEKKQNALRFLECFVIGMAIVIAYTIINHSQYGFGEKEGHWVMSPFFKDHTIYGMAVALELMLILDLYFRKKQNPLMTFIYILGILLVLAGLYYSYTRAAQLSVACAIAVGVAIKWKIPFKWIAGVAVVGGLVLFLSWDTITMELSRNKNEHTTENFTERLQSATNISTDASNLERLNRWDCAWEMFLDRPVMGFGPGTYTFEYAAYQDPENLTIISTNFGTLGNAHSEYLGPLSETGIIGFLLVIAMVAALFYFGITLYYRLEGDKEWQTIIFFIILAITTYYVHGFLNNYLDTDKAAVPIWGMAAIIIAIEKSLKKQKA